MNAPRQGLFASLLIVCFVLQTFLLVMATTHQLNENRANQGQLMTTQIVTDSLSELDPANTISLALLVSRYASNPSVAEIRILDAKQQVLATGGMAKTRSGETFVRDAISNEKKVGTIEVTLIKPSIGEILRTQWLAILVSFFLYVFLWLAYRTIARPTRSEYLARLNEEHELKNKIQQLTEEVELEKKNNALLRSQVSADPSHKTNNVEPVATAITEDTITPELVLNIQFYDPRQLLNSVTHSVALNHFSFHQLLLKKCIAICAHHYKINQDNILMISEFNLDGATLSLKKLDNQYLRCLLMIATIFQLLSEAMYKRYRQEKRFALQTRFSISNAVEAMHLNAIEAAQRLTQSLHAKESAVHLDNDQLTIVNHCYQLSPMPNPNSILMRQAYMLNGMEGECAELAEKLRTDILQGKNIT